MDFFDVMKEIQGPFSLIYFNGKTKRLYFARDSLGRQTLLIGLHQDSIVITSVASKEFGPESFIEVPPIGIFCLNLSVDACDFEIKLNAWQDLSSHEHFNEQLKSLEKLFGNRILLKENLEPFWMTANDNRSNDYSFIALLNEHTNESPLEILTLLSESQEISSVCDELISLLTNSLKQRVEATPSLCKNCIKSKFSKASVAVISCDHPKIGILFSGGIDCTILAVLADKFIDKTSAIDLVNVSFEKIVRNQLAKKQQTTSDSYETPDRLTSRQTLNELLELCPERKWNLIEVNVTREELKNALTHKISDLCYPLNSILDESLGAALWFAASAKGTISDSVNYESPCRVRKGNVKR